MRKKLIAIGNQMMKDDGIGIRVAENLAEYLYEQNITVIIGETDVDFCLSQIEDGDFLIILDAAYFDTIPGNIHVISLENIDRYLPCCVSQHQPNLLRWLMLHRKSVTGFFIGIEVVEVGFGWELSEPLQELLPKIGEEVKRRIHRCLGGVHHA